MKSIYNKLNEIYEDEYKKQIIDGIIAKYQTPCFQLNSSMYILPDGTLLNLGDTGYGHSDLSKYLHDCGIEQDYKQGQASNFLFSLGWIRVNNRYKFITLPKVKLTSNQYQKLIELFDMYKTNYQVSTLDNQTKTYNDRTSDEVVGLIKRYYSSGTLYENLQN